MKCVDCKNDAVDGRIRCQACLARRKESMRARRARFQKTGGCRDCGAPTALGHSQCPACLDKRKAADKRMLDRREKKNLCLKCGQPLEKGSSYKTHARGDCVPSRRRS